MIPIVPNAFRTKSQLNVDAVNENLLRIARDIADVQSQVYTRCLGHLDLAGITNASAQVLRELAIRRPSGTQPLEIIAVELVLYTDAAVTATVACSDATFPSFSVATVADPTVETTASSDNAVAIPSAAADVTFTVSFSAAVNVVAGYLIVHGRSNRYQPQGGAIPYKPTLLNASIDPDSVALQDEIDSIATSVTIDSATGAQGDLRFHIVAARNLAPGSSVVFRIPGGPGADKDFAVDVYVVAANTVTGRCTVQDLGATVNVDVVGTGIASRAHGVGVLNSQGGTDPMNAAHDLLVTLKNQAGAANVLLIYAVVWWT